MDALAKIQEKKAALQAEIKKQETQIGLTISDIRAEFQLAGLLFKTVNGLVGIKDSKDDRDKTERFERLSLAAVEIADSLVHHRRLSFLIKLLAPIVLNYFVRKDK